MMPHFSRSVHKINPARSIHTDRQADRNKNRKLLSKKALSRGEGMAENYKIVQSVLGF